MFVCDVSLDDMRVASRGDRIMFCLIMFRFHLDVLVLPRRYCCALNAVLNLTFLFGVWRRRAGCM